MAYWKGEDYVGIGPGAVSTINGIRYSNTRDTDAYIRSTLEKRPPLSEQEPVTEEDYRLERIALMLRTDEGLPLKYILPESRPLLEQYRELGLADISGTKAHPERAADACSWTPSQRNCADRHSLINLIS